MNEYNLTNSEIKTKFSELWNDSKIKPQERGYIFEKLIKAKLENELLEPRAGYKPKAEQIDGSFFWEGRTFLFEAKWEKEKLPASSLYSFQGKLNGKFHTTSGVFLSVNGYSKDVEEGLKTGKPLNIVLFDSYDIQIIFNNEVTFLEVLKFKLRQAGDTGSLNVPYNIKKEVQTIVEADLNYMFIDDFTELSKADDFYTNFLVFVEDHNYVKSIQVLLNSKNIERQLSYKIIVLEGLDKIRELPALINQYLSEFVTSAILVVLDEAAQEDLRIMIDNTLKNLENSSIFVNTKFLFLNRTLKKLLQSSKGELSASDIKVFERTKLYQELGEFLQNVVDEYYYDPVVDLPYETFQGVMSQAEWDFKNKEISFPHYSGMPFTINNIEDLVQHLNDEAASAMDGTMPLDWLKEQNGLDYDYEAREFLLEHYKKEIKKLKWDINAL